MLSWNRGRHEAQRLETAGIIARVIVAVRLRMPVSLIIAGLSSTHTQKRADSDLFRLLYENPLRTRSLLTPTSTCAPPLPYQLACLHRGVAWRLSNKGVCHSKRRLHKDYVSNVPFQSLVSDVVTAFRSKVLFLSVKQSIAKLRQVEKSGKFESGTVFYTVPPTGSAFVFCTSQIRTDRNHQATTTQVKGDQQGGDVLTTADKGQSTVSDPLADRRQGRHQNQITKAFRTEEQMHIVAKAADFGTLGRSLGPLRRSSPFRAVAGASHGPAPRLPARPLGSSTSRRPKDRFVSLRDKGLSTVCSMAATPSAGIDALGPKLPNWTWQQTMLRIKDPEASLKFYRDYLGLTLVDKIDFPQVIQSTPISVAVRSRRHDAMMIPSPKPNGFGLRCLSQCLLDAPVSFACSHLGMHVMDAVRILSVFSHELSQGDGVQV